MARRVVDNEDDLAVVVRQSDAVKQALDERAALNRSERLKTRLRIFQSVLGDARDHVDVLPLDSRIVHGDSFA